MKTIGMMGLALLGFLGALVMAAVPPLSGREAVVWCIEKWDSGCKGTTVPWWTPTSKWYEEISDTRQSPHGHGSSAWVKAAKFVNNYSFTRPIYDSDFTDSNKVSWGRDNYFRRPDDADACMISLHGNVSNNRWTGLVQADAPPGDDSNNCSTWQGHMEFGEAGADLEFLHVYSCKSMQDPNVTSGRGTRLWGSSFKGVHQINGFHGLTWISRKWYPDRYRDFADDSFYMPIADAWLDNLYRRRAGATNDNCPVSRAVGVGGDSQADCWNRFNRERYNNVFSDPSSPTWHCWAYVSPCSPAEGNGL